MTSASSGAGDCPAPSLALLGLEPVRAAIEYVGARCMERGALPAGDGHPVLLFPGLAADATLMAPLRHLCEGLGYATEDWGRGFNTGPGADLDAWIAGLADEVEALSQRQGGQRVSLVGWSLGGLYAREIARLRPDLVRQVVTLGTPFGADGSSTHVAWLFRLLSGREATLEPALAERLRATPPVPTTSVYSRTDGVVAWQACVEREDHGQAESVEVEASHIGIVWHPRVWAVLADRLSLPDGTWRPFADGADDASLGFAARCTARVSAGVGRLAA